MQQDIWFQKYRIVRLLGKGGNAEVYLAEHIKLNSFRAIKCLSKSHPLYHLQCKEALILKNLKHSCIPIIYDIEEDEDGSYIVEQYIEGETLKDYVMSKGSVREETILHFGLQLCDLISYLHSFERPVLYVDLKPDNIIVTGQALKLVDFGSAIYRDELTEHQPYLGTRGYAAPELYGKDIIDERCDVYGIGMLLYYMATGQEVKGCSEFDNIDNFGKYSGKLKKIINCCLKFHPSQRLNSVDGLSRELSALMRTNQFHASPNLSVKIGIAGSQTRIGVTHLAFSLCRYLINQGFRCLYQERNSSGCVWSVKDCLEEVEVIGGIPVINGIPMHAYESNYPTDQEKYDIILQDFGVLSEDNKADFLNADVKLLILGAKEWELKQCEQVIKLTAEYKDITYLFNFVNGRQFQRIIKSMEHKQCYRIPYEPDPFANITTDNGRDFFRSIIGSLLAGPRRKSIFLRGRKHEA